MGESFIFHLKSLLLVMHVLLSIFYCRSFASGILDVFASFEICFTTRFGGRLCSSENFSRVPQCLGLKDVGNIVLARSLQNFLLGRVAKRMVSALGRKFSLKVASLQHRFLMFLVAIFNKFRETAFQLISGSLCLRWEGGRTLNFSSVM